MLCKQRSKLPSIVFLTARIVQTQWNGLVRIENTFDQVGGKYVWFGALAASWGIQKTHVTVGSEGKDFGWKF